MSEQQQFLEVVDRDEAQRRFHAAISLAPLEPQRVKLENALGRVLADDIAAAIDVPSFDRSNFDGFAVQASDTFGCDEERPRRLQLSSEIIATAVSPETEIQAGTAVAIATGGMLPRGADAVVMVEHADVDGRSLLVRRAVTPGFGVAFAGTDVAAGEIVLRRGDLLTSRETGVLAAIGIAELYVQRQPRVGILSTGDEIIEPGSAMRPGLVYDSNARILADAVRELGATPIALGIVHDDLSQLREVVADALQTCDIVLLSGGTSKGTGDLSYRVVREFDDPGIVAHGVALKPGKPICLAATQNKPIVILPGFPTSAIFTFHEFVAPVIRRLAGRSPESRSQVSARMAVKVNSEIGRTEFLLVGLVPIPAPSTPASSLGNATGQPEATLAAFPLGKGSGSVTTFSHADGFVTIQRHEELVEAGSLVDVQLLGRDLQPADLVVIGSHCVGLDYLLGRIQQLGYRTKFLAVGSTAGLEAARRGECDLAGIHLLDIESGQYNRPFVDDRLELISGYGRQQGIVFRPGDHRFQAADALQMIEAAKQDPHCLMVNRNQGSGTRILIDQLLKGSRPPGYAVQPRSHNAVAAAVAQKRADWGVAIQRAAEQAGLGFAPLTAEQYDFVVPRQRTCRPAVQAFRDLLRDAAIRRQLAEWGFLLD
jgi:putative molybdopterin biosynthesis protein